MCRCRELESAECNVYNHGWLIKQMSPVHSWPISIKSSQWMMRTEQPTLSCAMFPVSSPPSVPDIQHTAVWQPVWVGCVLCACKHWWLHIYEQELKTTVIPTILSRRSIYSSMQLLVTVKCSTQNSPYTLRPIIGLSDMAAEFSALSKCKIRYRLLITK